MSGLCLFLNSEILDSGKLAQFGNWGLSPIRYFFNGRTVRIHYGVGDESSTIDIRNYYGKKSVLKTLLMAGALFFVIVPILIKFLSHLYTENSQKHDDLRNYLEGPVIRRDLCVYGYIYAYDYVVGTKEKPIVFRQSIQQALQTIGQHDQRLRIFIFGRNLRIEDDPTILSKHLTLDIDSGRIKQGIVWNWKLVQSFNDAWGVNFTRIVATNSDHPH